MYSCIIYLLSKLKVLYIYVYMYVLVYKRKNISPLYY